MAAGDIIIPDGKITPEILQKITNEVVNNIQTTSKDPGQYEVVNSLQDITSIPVFQQTGATYKLVRVLVSILKGVDGKEVHLQSTETHLQWRWTDGMWSNLIAWADLKGDPGDTPVFRTSSVGIEWKYDSEEDSAWKILVKFEVLKLKFSDLTDEQITAFWRAIPDDVLAMFQKPATDAAADARKEITNMRQLESTVEEQEDARENFYSQVQAKEQVRQNDEIKRQEAAAAQAEAERLRGLKEDERNATFDAKVREATDAAAEAKTQGDYAKKQGDKAALLAGRVTALEEGKVDGGYSEEGLLQLTSGGLPIGDPIEVGSGSGGGGGTAGISCKVKAITDTLISTVSGASVRIGYSFTSIYADDGSETGDGTATYTINSQKVATEAIQQGNVYFDVTKWLQVGTNTIKVTVKDSTGQSRSVAFTVDVISMSITDSYDDAQVNTGEITYRYTPVGAIAKTIHFILDGAEIGTEDTSTSNRQLSYVIPAQTHGAHRLAVYMTAMINGAEVRSNELAHDLICTVTGNNAIIVASSFNQVDAQQYDRLSIPFVVYNPASSVSTVTLSVNDTVLSEQTVDRTKQVWNYHITRPGALALKIASGNVSKTFNLNVTEAGVIVEPETADLALFLTAANRSNNDNNKEEWKYSDITAALTNFNYKTNGWITENNSTVLRVSGDARVAIPYYIFSNDFRASGKTIEFEFETRDVIDYDAVVIECQVGGIGLQVTAQEALFKSEQTTVSTWFKEEERVRVSFVVEKKADNRLIYIYINGVLSGVAQYPNDDNFQQASPVGIMVGSNDCTVDLFNIRIYDNNLTEYQLLDNYIADIDDYDKKITVYDRNQVYTAYGDISYDATLNLVPGLIIIGELPTYKGDKKTVTLIYTDKQHPERSFIAYNVQIDVQGTSSQYYPRKNFKFKLKNGLTMSESGEDKDAYPLRPDSIPATVFCTKADFAESSGTHNTGMAVIADKLLKDLDILVPPQKTNKKVRTTVDGFPICIFHRSTADSEIEFVGKYNFNYDKGAEETFGFAEGDESWEFCNNTSDRVLFKSADFTGTDWTNDFEARYPDDDAINAEYEAGTRKPTNLMAVMEWITSTTNDTGKFKTEVTDHFDLNNLLSYYLFTEVFAMVDQRAKNMFLTRYAADGKWRFILYDNDTCLGINNEGLISFGYNVEYHDKIGTLNVWNGEGSVLWKNVEACFLAEIEAMYKDIRSKGYLSYDYVMSVLNGEQSDKWCEAIYNADGKFKYVDPLINDGNGSYLYAAQGSRKEHRKWWAYNRFLYMDSKYTAGDFLSDYATLRLYTPTDFAGVTPSANFNITPFADEYVRVKYGSYVVGQRCTKDEVADIVAPDIQFNDTETIVYGASRIKSLGNLSGMYAGTVDVSKATRLSELLIGSDAEGYHNDNLTVLSVGSNKMFRKLDIRNCPNLTQAVDLSGCENIEEVYAQGTGITSVVLPPAGILSKLYLPGTITNLTLKNQPKLLDAFFELAGVEKLSTIVYENSGVDIFSIIARSLTLQTPVLTRVRLVNINGHAGNLDTLYKLISIGGIDEHGNNIDRAVITGKFHADTVRVDRLAIVQAAFPELTITYFQIKELPTTTFTFTSSQNKIITNAVFECNFEFTKVNESTYKVIADEGEVIEIAFKCDNHRKLSATYEVAGTRTQNYTVTYMPLVKLRINVYGTSTYVDGAVIKIGSEIYTSDADGYVQVRTDLQINGTVSAIGYKEQPFTVAPQSKDTTVNIYLYQTVMATFTVKDEYGSLIIGSVIECNGESKTTNRYGQCTFEIAKGSYDYTVTNNMYESSSGSIIVSTSNTTENVTTKINWETFNVAPTGNILLYAKNAFSSSVYLEIISEDAGYVIDWGDGVTVGASGVGRQNYSHNYGYNQGRVVEISNCEGITKCGQYAQNNILAYFSIGNSKISNITFYNNSDLKIVGEDVFKNDGERKDYSGCFYGCVNLLRLPSHFYNTIFDSCSFYNFCNGCSNLQEAPSLWETATNTSNSIRSFQDCKNASNWNDIPSEWGGPLMASEVRVAIFKNNTWYLNQRVTVNGYSLTQMADGTYKGTVKAVGGLYDLLVNGIVQGSVKINLYADNRIYGYYFIGDNPEIYQEGYFMDFSQGDLHEDCVGIYNCAYDAEKGGLTSVRESNDGINQVFLYIKKQAANPLGLYCGRSCKVIFSKQGDTTFAINGLTWKEEYENEEVTGSIPYLDSQATFSHIVPTSSAGYVCIKSITIDKITLPELPADFVPAAPVSGAVLADYYAVNRRLARVETALGLND